MNDLINELLKCPTLFIILRKYQNLFLNTIDYDLLLFYIHWLYFVFQKNYYLWYYKNNESKREVNIMICSSNRMKSEYQRKQTNISSIIKSFGLQFILDIIKPISSSIHHIGFFKFYFGFSNIEVFFVLAVDFCFRALNSNHPFFIPCFCTYSWCVNFCRSFRTALLLTQNWLQTVEYCIDTSLTELSSGFETYIINKFLKVSLGIAEIQIVNLVELIISNNDFKVRLIFLFFSLSSVLLPIVAAVIKRYDVPVDRWRCSTQLNSHELIYFLLYYWIGLIDSFYDFLLSMFCILD